MRQTAKYKAAVSQYRNVQGLFAPSDAETLYKELSNLGFFWDAKQAAWLTSPTPKAIDPSGVVKIRLTSHSDEIEGFTARITETVKSAGFRVLDCSEPYRNTRKATHESRVYMQIIRG